jgi:hypothetical protein
LEESIVDMLACQWERRFDGASDVSASKLATIDDVYMKRYTPKERDVVKKYLKNISDSK